MPGTGPSPTPPALRLSAESLRRGRRRGAGQRRAGGARRVGVTDVAVIGLAKRLEEVWVLAEPDPVILPRNSEGLYLLHGYGRSAPIRRLLSPQPASKRMTASALDTVRGLGETRRKALVTHFSSLARLRQASVQEITAVPGIGVATATAVLEALGVAGVRLPVFLPAVFVRGAT